MVQVLPCALANELHGGVGLCHGVLLAPGGHQSFHPPAAGKLYGVPLHRGGPGAPGTGEHIIHPPIYPTLFFTPSFTLPPDLTQGLRQH